MSTWGAQWNKQAMAYLLELGPDKSFKNILAKYCAGSCLVLGAGSETKVINKICNDFIGINISREEMLPSKGSKVKLVLGDGQKLPFKASAFDVVVCKSTLHHFTNLDGAIVELRRVLREGGLVFLYEPGILNPVAFFGRKLFPTNIHVESERPFIPILLRKMLVNFKFDILEEEYYYIFVHILPIIAKWITPLRRKKLLHLCYRLDAARCRTFLKNLCWILVLVIKKR